MITNPLYGMISEDGSLFTVAFPPRKDAADRPQHTVTRSVSPTVFSEHAGTDIPVIDMRTAVMSVPFNGVHEEYQELQILMFGARHPTLAEFCADVQLTGATVWPLSKTNFQHFASTGLSPGTSQAMINDAMLEKLKTGIRRPAAVDREAAIRESVATDGLRFGRNGVSTAQFLEGYLRHAEKRAAIDAAAPHATADQREETRGEAESLHFLINRIPPQQFEAALCHALADRVDPRRTINTENDPTWEPFVNAIGASSHPEGKAKEQYQATVLRLRTLAILGFQEHLEIAYGVTSLDFKSWARASDLPVALRTRAADLDRWLTEEPPVGDLLTSPTEKKSNFAALVRAALGKDFDEELDR